MELRAPTMEELQRAINAIEPQGTEVEGKIELFHKSARAHYYNSCIMPYGAVTLKVCLDSSTEEQKSFDRSKQLIEVHNATSVVVEPKVSFKFENLRCFIYEQFKPFSFGVKVGVVLTHRQLELIKDICHCLSFLVDSGGHGRVDDSSVCSLAICRGRGMMTDLWPKSWPIKPSTPDDFKAYGSVLESLAKKVFSQKLPQDLNFLIIQLKRVSFVTVPIYKCFDKHPIFYSSVKKMVYFMFGSVESEVIAALKAKANPILKGLNVQSSPVPKAFQSLRASEIQALETKLRFHLNLLGSYPNLPSVSTSSGTPASPSLLGSRSAPHSSSVPLVSASPSATSSAASPSVSTSPATSPSVSASAATSPSVSAPAATSPSVVSPSASASSASPSVSTPSAPPSVSASPSAPPSVSASPSPVSKFYWMNVYTAHQDIHKVWKIGQSRNVKYDYSATLDYLRFIRNVYAHIVSHSQLNEKQREGLFREVDKMWPGFIYAVFVTLSEMDTILDG